MRRIRLPAEALPLLRRDAVLRRLIRAVGPCTLRYNPDRFAVLAQSIISQQISTRAALAIRARLIAALAPEGLHPTRILETSEPNLRSLGLSAAKARSMRDLAEKVVLGDVPLARLHRLDDEEVIERLIPVRGIGRWTAQMFLIFALGRGDVLPVDDWGLRAAVQRHYNLKKPPGRAELEELGERWRPYRTIATWYFWRGLGFVPQSEAARNSRKRRAVR
jgi:DNA-3-methyladenine glycosylase II